MPEAWRNCSSCRKPLAFDAPYYVCSVSTCDKKRGGYAFCSVECWETHVPMMRHRDAGAIEKRAPTRAAFEAEEPGEDTGAATAGRRVTVPVKTPPANDVPREVLVIASRFKAYVRTRYGMNCSDSVLDPLSDKIRRLADRAVLQAREDGRKTLLDRDFSFLQLEDR